MEIQKKLVWEPNYGTQNWELADLIPRPWINTEMLQTIAYDFSPLLKHFIVIINKLSDINFTVTLFNFSYSGLISNDIEIFNA